MSSKEIVEKEIIDKLPRPKIWRNARFVFYLLALLIIFVPSKIPFPYAPEVLYDSFGGGNGALLTVLVFLLFISCLAVLSCCFLYQLVFHRKLNKSLLLEIFGVPILFIGIGYLLGIICGDIPQRIALINQGRQPEEFHNPYLEYEMLDCRNLTDEFDVIFMPSHLMIETEYLAYAPRRKKKTIDYISGKKYGDDWYWEFSGSQWSNELRNCLWQNKSPKN